MGMVGWRKSGVHNDCIFISILKTGLFIHHDHQLRTLPVAHEYGRFVKKPCSQAYIRLMQLFYTDYFRRWSASKDLGSMQGGLTFHWRGSVVSYV